MTHASTAHDLPPDEKRMTLGEHLEELRWRLVRSILWWAVCTGVVAYFRERLMGLVLRPTMEALEKTGQVPEIIYLNPADSFTVAFKFILLIGAFVSAPFVFREIWGFVAAGLYGRERRLVERAAPLSYLLFVAGCVFFYLWILPTALEFLYGYGRDLFPDHSTWMVTHKINIADYVSFWLWMSLSMGVVFQLPLVMDLVHRMGLVKAATFSKYRRHFILGAAIVAAVITPTGDAVTLSLFMIPILLLFEGGLLLVRMRERGARKAEA